MIHNQPANSTWRARYLWPDGSAGFDSGARTSGTNVYTRWMAAWFSFMFDPDTTGAWKLEFSVNGQVLVNAPFFVMPSGAIPINRPPQAPSAIGFDPPAPLGDEALFCRLTVPLLADADYDVVSYRYEWFVNSTRFRTVTNAAFADAIPRGAAPPGGVIRCVVTPHDGRSFGIPIEPSVTAGTVPALQINNAGLGRVVLSWPAAAANYVLQATSPWQTTNTWTSAGAVPVRVGERMFLTNSIPATATSRWYRLSAP